MKKYFLSVILSLACATSMFAQTETKNQLTLGAGFLTIPTLEDIAVTIGSLGGSSYNNTTSALSVEYLRYVTPKLALGGTLSLEKQWGTFTETGEKKKIGQTDIVVMPTISYHWYNNEHFGVYSKAAAGIDVIAYKDNTKELVNGNTAEFAYQVSPIGIDMGNQKFRFFAEGGVGYQGIVNVGLHYNF